MWLMDSSLRSKTREELHEQFILLLSERQKEPCFRGSGTSPGLTPKARRSTCGPRAGGKAGSALAVPARSAFPARPPAALPLPAARGDSPGHRSLLPGIQGSHVCSAGRVNNFTWTRSRIEWVFDRRVRSSLVQSERSFTNPSSDEFSTPTQWPGVTVICAFDLCLSPLWVRWQFNRVKRARLN